MHGANPGREELLAARAAFSTVVAEWCLTRAEVRLLLRLPCEPPEVAVLPPVLNADAEARMRLVVEIARGARLVMDPPEASRWLRRETFLHDDLSPLHDMAQSVFRMIRLRNIMCGQPPWPDGIHPADGR